MQQNGDGDIHGAQIVLRARERARARAQNSMC